MNIRRNLICGVLAVLSLSAAAQADDRFFLKDGDTVVFYGDSITDQRLYTTFAETYVVTRFPQMNIRFVHSGWGGDRVTGGGGGPIDVRLQRDVLAYKPTVMTIMLGMNDGRYRAFDPEVFNAYANGYKYIVKTVKTALPAVRITAIEPSPYDDVTRPPSFEGGYNAVLIRYGQFLKELAASEGLSFADLNTSVVNELGRALAIDPKAGDTLIRDRVHPGPGGHLLMAKALLKAWNAPAVVSEAEIDGETGTVTKAENTEVTGVSKEGGISWTELDHSLPMPFDMKDAGVSLALKASDVETALDEEVLRVKNLPAKTYALRIDDQDIGTFTADQLGSGINLAMLATPMSKQAADVHTLTLRHADIHNARWRNVQVPLEPFSISSKQAAMDALDQLEADLVKQQHAAAQPKPHRYQLSAIGE